MSNAWLYAQPDAQPLRPWDRHLEYAETYPMRVPPQWVTFGAPPPPSATRAWRVGFTIASQALAAAMVLFDLLVTWALCAQYARCLRVLGG